MPPQSSAIARGIRQDAQDPRSRKTRADLLRAFFALALSRRYHEIRITDVLLASGVAKSTFYEHFSGKDALLSASMEGPLGVLAGLVDDSRDVVEVAAILAHFHENGTLARSLFQGPAARVVREALVAEVEARLRPAQRARLRLPPRLAAHALAEGLLAPVIAWLRGEAACNAAVLASGLAACIAGMRDALLVGGAGDAGGVVA